MGFIIREQRKPRGFTHRPIYYNPEAERAKELQAAQLAAASGDQHSAEAIRTHMRASFANARLKRRETQPRRKLRGLTIFVLLGLALFLYFQLA